ncbi:hypothetical protein J7643_10075 [bacterium]|nr:hypothetical protein [bacterium]
MHQTNLRLFGAGLGLAMLAGCALAPTIRANQATLSLTPTVRQEGLKTLAAGLSPYTPEDVDHLQIKVFKLVGDSEVPLLGNDNLPVTLDVASTSLGKSVLLANLHFDTTYRIRGYAYADAGTASLISSASSFVDVGLGRDDRPAKATLPVQLVDKATNYSATSPGISLTNGAYVASGSTGLNAKVVVTTLAGKPSITGAADGVGTAATFYAAFGITTDAAGNVYVVDRSNCNIRKITPAGVVTTLAGLAGVMGTTDGATSSARFRLPSGLASDAAGNLYVGDSWNSSIRKVTPAGVVTTFAGMSGVSGTADGATSSARFTSPNGMAVDRAGNVYVADTNANTIRKITPDGVVSTLAGASATGSVDATGTAARFNKPWGVTVDASGTLYVADTENYTIRKITPDGVVTTLAGQVGVMGNTNGTGAAATFGTVYGLAVDALGDVYVADMTAHLIRKISPAGQVSPFAGYGGSWPVVDGVKPADSAFNQPQGVAVDATNNIYISDTNNRVVRKIQ